MNYKTDMGLLIKDIVMSKGYDVYLDWSIKKKDVFDLVDSLDKKINITPNMNKSDKLLNSEIVKSDFEQLEFKF